MQLISDLKVPSHVLDCAEKGLYKCPYLGGKGTSQVWAGTGRCRETKMLLHGPDRLGRFALSPNRRNLRILLCQLTGHMMLNKYLSLSWKLTQILSVLRMWRKKKPHTLLEQMSRYLRLQVDILWDKYCTLTIYYVMIYVMLDHLLFYGLPEARRGFLTAV